MQGSTADARFEAIMAGMRGGFWLGQTLVSDLMGLVRSLSQNQSSSAAKPGLVLTPREREVVRLVIAGHTNKQIATMFSVSEETIKHHLTRMFQKVGASNRLELAMKATKSGFVAGADLSASVR